ncbi:MAG TPA: OmpA family protein [Myxococcaceae bacterium]|nr:OmpA family protein [Myxococcaceae bacterium]
MKRTAAAALLLLLTSACVTKGTYEALQTEHDATLDQLKARNATIRDREKELEAAQANTRDLERALEDEKQKLAALNEQLRSLEERQAKMLKDKTTLEASVSEMTDALAELQRRKEAADARVAEFRSLLSKFKGLIDAGKLKVQLTDGRMKVVLASDVLFNSGSAELSKEGLDAVTEVGKLLASIKGRQFQVEGHTDNVPINTKQYPSNWELAAARAVNVTRTMLDAGMPASRISAASYGDSLPAASNKTAKGRALNRRIDIIIVPDLSSLPGFEELQALEHGA